MEQADWPALSDEDLLERRMSKLGLRLDGTTLEALIWRVYDELSQEGLAFLPPCHIGDEMVRADRGPGDFHSVFSGARSAARARADDDARGRGRDDGVVHEIDAARSGAERIN